jgi:hypothetical protein
LDPLCQLHAIAWCGLLGLFWLAFYIFYFVRMSRA